jgi:hypothetical protein
VTLDVIQAMLAEDERVWAELCAVLDAHPDVNLHSRDSKPWNSRDAYAHLARWMEYSTKALKALVAGEKPFPPILEDVSEELNVKWQAEDTSLNLKEARKRAMYAFQERQYAIQAIPSAMWGGEIEKFARFDGAHHFRDHLSYITLTDARPYLSTTTGPENR